jgi:PAS domain S-box-containing protein
MNVHQEAIADAAYANWLSGGRQPGTDVENWLAAEATQLRHIVRSDQTPGQVVPPSSDLLPAVLEHSPAVVSVKDARGRYLLVNRRYEVLFHVPQADMAGTTDYDHFPADVADAVRANDRQVLAAGAPCEFEEVIPQDDGPHTYLSLKFPIAGPDAVPYAVCGISTDITDRKRAERRLAAEHSITRALAQSDGVGDAAPKVLRAVCECLDWDVGILWLADPAADVLRCAGLWHVPAAPLAAFARLNRDMTFAPGAGLPGGVWADGRPAWVADVAGELTLPRAPAAAAAGLHGACGFPVRNGGAPIGVIEFFSRDVREADRDVMEMLASITSQLSQFAERRQAEKRLHERESEMDLARAIQRKRLPNAAPSLAGFDIAGASEPARETGGDYLDFIPAPDGSLTLAVGDASGHGLSAALLMAETRAYVRVLSGHDADVGTVLGRANRRVAESVGDEFVTLLLARLTPGTRTLVYSNAGHWPGYILDPQGAVRAVLDSTGLPLGVDPSAEFPDAAPLTIEAGELILLLSDGMVDAFSPAGGPFGIGRVLDCVRAHVRRPAADIVAALFTAVRAYSAGEQTDDMTAVIVKAAPT